MSDGIEQWKLMSKEELYDETEMLRRVIAERRDEIRQLQEREETKWKPLLAAATFGHDEDCHASEPRESGDCELCKRIAACGENK